jgi:exo-beta-1,3-glucanase (GH17 family)
MKNLNVLDALLNCRNWINYSPSKPFNLYAGNKVEEKQITDELLTLYAAGFRGLSTFGFYNGLENIPRIARDIGFEKVISLLWWPNEELYQIEKINLSNNIQYIDSILVGNEVIHKGTTNMHGLYKEIAALKRLYKIPITTGLHRLDYIRHPELASTDMSDYIMYNLQTWWVNVRRDPVDGAGWIKAMYDELRGNPLLSPDKPIIVHEASWPCGDNVPVGLTNVQSQHNQKIFYEKLLEYKIPFIWSFSSDQFFAKEKSPPGGYGGLWTEDWQPKEVVKLVVQSFAH